MRKISFGEEAYTYLREQLALGDDLANALLQLPLESGSMLGYFPDEVNSPESFKFELSILLTTGIDIVSELWASRTALISQYLKKDERNYAIFETFLEVNDPYLTSLDIPYIIHESKIYLTISPQNFDVSKVERAKGVARAYPCIWILISLPTSLSLDPKSEINRATFEILTKDPDYVFADAYDEEGCVIWENSQAKYRISL
jgi:hypothetical protein